MHFKHRVIAGLGALAIATIGAVSVTAPASAEPDLPPQAAGHVPQPPRFGPDERPTPVENLNGKKDDQGREIVPPAAPVIGAKRADVNGYSYTGQYRQEANVTAMRGKAVITKPTTGGVANLDTKDYHTLYEQIVCATSTCANDLVEVGFAIDNQNVFGQGTNRDPRLFVSAWYDNGAGGKTWCGSYMGGCGWVDYSANPINAGANLVANVNTESEFQIVFDAPGPTARIWVWYKTNWVGSWPQTLDHGRSFTNADGQQAFGELAYGHLPSCSDMGNGYLAAASGSYPTFGAYMNGLWTHVSGGTYAAVDFTGNLTMVDATKWNRTDSGTGGFHYGGPGWAAGSCP